MFTDSGSPERPLFTESDPPEWYLVQNCIFQLGGCPAHRTRLRASPELFPARRVRLSLVVLCQRVIPPESSPAKRV